MQNDRYPFAPPPAPGDTAKPRRRIRRHSNGNKNRQGASAASGQGNAPQASRPAQQPPKEKAAQPGQNQNQQAKRRQPQPPRRGEKSAAAPRQPAPNLPAKNKNGRQPQQPERRPRQPESLPTPAPRNHRPAPRAAAPVSEDPGLLLIARRAPKQKFANFEEYIAARGGVSAPLPEEPKPAEEEKESCLQSEHDSR